MGDEPYFNANIMRRVRIVEIAEDLLFEIKDWERDVPGLDNPIIMAHIDIGASKMAELVGAVHTEAHKEGGKSEWVKMAAQYYAGTMWMSNTHMQLMVMIFASAFMHTLGDPEHWEHQQSDEVTSVLSDVTENGKPDTEGET